MKVKITALIISIVLIISMGACSGASGGAGTTPTAQQQTQQPESTPNTTETEPPTPAVTIDKDREGNPITLPDKIERIVSMGPSNTEVITALGYADKIVATDEYSANVPGIDATIPMFSMMTPDGEQLIGLTPDIVIVTGMSRAGGDDPYKPLSDAGVCVVYIPSSTSIDGIKEDIRFMAALLGKEAEGNSLITDMETKIDAIRKIGETINDKKTVYFEISAAPYMYSFGNGVFLNELIELIGAENIFKGVTDWISVADESILEANPDVILTSVNYLDDPVGEIMARPGWDSLTAVQNGEVYYIDTDASNRPSHNIVKALDEMAKAVYPDLY